MKPTQLYRHVTTHNGKFTWQLSILGHPCRTSAHFDTAEQAALSVDLVKFYLRTEFKLDLPASLDGDLFSDLAYSRRHVDLSDYLSVLKSMPEDVKDFLFLHRPALEAYKAASPPETTASKFRRSGMIEIPAVREWVEGLEQAEADARAFATIDADNFFLRLKVVASSLTAAIKSLHLTMKTHNSETCGTNPRLVQRRQTLAALVVHLDESLDYVKALDEALRAEEEQVRSAVAVLEANRPPLA